MMSVSPNPTLPQNTITNNNIIKGRRKSNSTSTHVSASSSGSGSGPGRKGKGRTKEVWDDDFVFNRPAPSAAPKAATPAHARAPSPVPSFADSAIWGDSSDEEEDGDQTIKLALPLSPSISSTFAPSPITPQSETASPFALETRLEAPAKRLVKKHAGAGGRDGLGLPLANGYRVSGAASDALPASPAATRLANSLEASSSAPSSPDPSAIDSRPKGVGRLLSRVSKRFSGSPVEDQGSSPLRRPKSSTNVNVNDKPPLSRSSSMRRSSSSILRAVHPSASTSSSISNHPPPLPAYPSPPLSAHPSRGFHLPSPSPNSPYHSASSLHGSGNFPARSTSSSSAQSEPIPPLPTSSSFPILTNRVQPDEDLDPARTPRRKARPVSVQVSKKPSLREAGLGLGLASESGWRANWKGPTTAPTHGQGSRKKSETSITFDMPMTPTTGRSQSALQRLGSLSKKHGRKLSGGWRFGSSLPNTEPPLPTVVASPAPPRDETASAPSSGFVPRSASMRQVDSREVSAAMESWTMPDEESPAKNTEKRRNSWNDLLIPRDVLAKQKELKAGMSAVRRFAKGVDSLKRMKEEYAMLEVVGQDRYAQWWEIADVLIEVGSTAAPEAEPGTPKPSRERRITLADSPRPTTPRASSDSVCHDAFPDTDDDCRVRQTEHWRASTGRQDLSKRQLEVLRNMLTSPSTASITSLSAHPTRPAATFSLPAPAATKSEISPRPANKPSATTPKPRRGSRAGLQSLKDFVRSLRSTSATSRSGSVKISQSPIAGRAPPVSYCANPIIEQTRSSLSGLSRGTASTPTPRPSVRAMFRSAPQSEVPISLSSAIIPDRGIDRVSEIPQLGTGRDLEGTVRPSNRRVLADLGGVIEGDGAGRSTSAQSAPVDLRGNGVIALTPENLGPLLEAVKACEDKLGECMAEARARTRNCIA